MNCSTSVFRRIRIACIAIGAVALIPVAALPDTGVRALRIGCSTSTDSIEIEPFIAWGDGDSPYPKFQAEDATKQSTVVDGSNWFYAFGIDDREFIYAQCNSKTRVLRVFVTNQREITVTEQGRAIIDALPVGDTWENWDAIYVLRSPTSGTWNECYGGKGAGYERLRCARFDSGNPKSKFLSQPAGSAK